MILGFIAVAVVSFIAGQKFGARVEKRAVDIALAVFTKAKAALDKGIARAQADVKAEAERLEALAKKYL